MKVSILNSKRARFQLKERVFPTQRERVSNSIKSASADEGAPNGGADTERGGRHRIRVHEIFYLAAPPEYTEAVPKGPPCLRCVSAVCVWGGVARSRHAITPQACTFSRCRHRTSAFPLPVPPHALDTRARDTSTTRARPLVPGPRLRVAWACSTLRRWWPCFCPCTGWVCLCPSPDGRCPPLPHHRHRQ